MTTMYNSPITITGRIVEDPVYHTNKDKTDGVLRLRVASSRSYKKGDEWTNIDQLYINVEAWGRLAINAHQALLKGTAIIVHGMLYTNEWEIQSAKESPDGKAVTRQEIRLRATSLGVDMSFYKVGYKDARPQLESNLEEVELAETNDNIYPDLKKRGQTDQEPAAETPDTLEKQGRDLVGVGATGETEEAPF